MLITPYCLYGFDFAAHWAEETQNPSITIKKSIRYSYVISCVVGFIYLVSILIALEGYVNTNPNCMADKLA
jgi:amino acid transporter